MVRRSSSKIRLGSYASPALRGLVVAGGAAAIAGCSGDPEVGQAATYVSAAQCASDGLVSAAICAEAEEEARADHAAVAPRYEVRGDCETDYERCELTRAEGRDWYVPFFTGFVVSQLIDEAGDALKRRKRYHPIYRSRDGGLVTAGGFYMPGFGRYPVSRSGFQSVSARPVRAESFARGSSQTLTRGAVGDLSTRPAYGSSGSRATISRGGFGSSGRSGG